MGGRKDSKLSEIKALLISISTVNVKIWRSSYIVDGRKPLIQRGSIGNLLTVDKTLSRRCTR